MRAESDESVSVRLELSSFAVDLTLPAATEVLRTGEPEALVDVPGAVAEALAAPIGGPPLAEICRGVLARGKAREAGAAPAPGRANRGRQRPTVAVVVSDNTRPVPYRGEAGVLWPLVRFLTEAGFPPETITLLVATGTHHRFSEEEMWALFDDRIREAGVGVHCHDAADQAALTRVGETARGSDVFMNRRYVEADLRILTGLVEPHLVAGLSGGRKSICPGLVDVRTLREFHGPVTLAHEKATDLILEGNPCHEAALEIARLQPPDFILNVTMRRDRRVAGVFAGDMEQAHLVAAEHVRSFSEIPLRHEYDVVVVHAGPVGVNHYQAQKAATAAARAARAGGYMVLIADTTDVDPLGSKSYRRLLKLLHDVGPEAFLQMIQAEEWEFVQDQWGVQIWGDLVKRIPADHVFYFSPQTAMEDYAMLPCVDPAPLLGDASGSDASELVSQFVAGAVAQACRASRETTGREPAVAYLADGPHGIPVRRE